MRAFPGASTDSKARRISALIQRWLAEVPIRRARLPVQRLPHVLTFSALYADGESLVRHFDRLGFAIASGSACTASTLEPSHVLAAMGVLTHGNVRVTLPLAAVAPGRAEAVGRFALAIGEVVSAVRRELGVQGL